MAFDKAKVEGQSISGCSRALPMFDMPCGGLFGASERVGDQICKVTRVSVGRWGRAM